MAKKIKRPTNEETFEGFVKMVASICKGEGEPTNEGYKEIWKLWDMVNDLKFPGFTCVMRPVFDGQQIVFFDDGEQFADVVEHFGSYGHEEDKLEIMGLLTEEEAKEDAVLGWLTAKDIVKRIKEYYKKKNKE